MSYGIFCFYPSSSTTSFVCLDAPAAAASSQLTTFTGDGTIDSKCDPNSDDEKYHKDHNRSNDDIEGEADPIKEEIDYNIFSSLTRYGS